MGMLAKWKKFERNAVFYDELKCERDTHSAGDLVICLSDFNGHVCMHIDRFDGVHAGLGVGRGNF